MNILVVDDDREIVDSIIFAKGIKYRELFAFQKHGSFLAICVGICYGLGRKYRIR